MFSSHWHDGLTDLTDKINSGLDPLVRQKIISPKPVRILREGSHPWLKYIVPGSAVVEYSLNVPVAKNNKKINLRVGYNIFEDRIEPTTQEIKLFTSILLADARKGYWPQPKSDGKKYPTYFVQEQFDEADIILSKMCGDLSLLQFDYTRAFLNSKNRKPRAVLMDGIINVDKIRETLLRGKYSSDLKLLPRDKYGYCSVGYGEPGYDCKVGLLLVSPL